MKTITYSGPLAPPVEADFPDHTRARWEGEPIDLEDEKADRLLASGEWEVVGDDTPAPDAKVDEIRDWVGDDVARARARLAEEQARPRPRSGLVKHLAALAVVNDSAVDDGTTADPDPADQAIDPAPEG